MQDRPADERVAQLEAHLVALKWVLIAMSVLLVILALVAVVIMIYVWAAEPPWSHINVQVEPAAISSAANTFLTIC